MTVGQAVIFAGRIRSLYRTGDPETGPAAYTAAAVGLKGTQRVYAPYLWYLQAEGVLDKALDDCLSDTRPPALRWLMCWPIFCRRPPSLLSTTPSLLRPMPAAAGSLM